MTKAVSSVNFNDEQIFKLDLDNFREVNCFVSLIKFHKHLEHRRRRRFSTYKLFRT
jgi:hypothetical protein